MTKILDATDVETLESVALEEDDKLTIKVITRIIKMENICAGGGPLRLKKNQKNQTIKTVYPKHSFNQNIAPNKGKTGAKANAKSKSSSKKSHVQRKIGLVHRKKRSKKQNKRYGVTLPFQLIRKFHFWVVIFSFLN